MNSQPHRKSEFFESDRSHENLLWEYIKSMQPEVISLLSKPESEVAQIMENSLISMLGNLPSEHFNVMVTTDREELSHLLASAMVSGYFLNNAKQRMEWEKSLSSKT